MKCDLANLGRALAGQLAIAPNPEESRDRRLWARLGVRPMPAAIGEGGGGATERSIRYAVAPADD